MSAATWPAITKPSIVVGAHLDSVGTGAGINDNGSGSSTNLEIAEQIAKMKLRNKVRFVWFSAEESGLLGSEAYVNSLPDSERQKIAAMLNFDMVGSPMAAPRARRSTPATTRVATTCSTSAPEGSTR